MHRQGVGLCTTGKVDGAREPPTVPPTRTLSFATSLPSHWHLSIHACALLLRGRPTVQWEMHQMSACRSYTSNLFLPYVSVAPSRAFSPALANSFLLHCIAELDSSSISSWYVGWPARLSLPPFHRMPPINVRYRPPPPPLTRPPPRHPRKRKRQEGEMGWRGIHQGKGWKR